VHDLPDLTPRIEKLGLHQEYAAFKSRYLEWRKGNAGGAKGEISAEHITRPGHVAANRGFAYWYPTWQEWQWRRTISYWIAITFFEGSIFFAVSSFMYNGEQFLGSSYDPLTLYGYMEGKVCFLICTYFMCVETINLVVQEDEDNSHALEKAPLFLWPYRYGTAVGKLNRVGAGPWPYYASSLYLTGVLVFGVGLAADFIPMSASLSSPVKLYSFVLGSILFTLGAIAECIQNNVFTSIDIHKGWLGAFFNLVGGTGFLMGAILAFSDSFSSNLSYGVGSILYMVSSSISIFMWQDQQFGLTFLAVLNNLGKPGGSAKPDDGDDSRISAWSAVFIHLCCICGALSTYNFNLEMMKHLEVDTWRSFQLAFNEFLPCLFSHMMLLLTSAVMHTPKVAPFRQMHVCAQVLILVMTVNSASTLVEFILHEIEE